MSRFPTVQQVHSVPSSQVRSDVPSDWYRPVVQSWRRWNVHGNDHRPDGWGILHLSYDQTSSGVTVELVPLPEWASGVLREAASRTDVLVLPRAVRDGRGAYRSADLPVVKLLRAAGVDADWAHQAPDRTFLAEYGVKEDALVIGLFVTQALGQESVVEVTRWLLGRIRQMLTGRTPSKDGPPVVVELVRLTVQGDRLDLERLRVTGKDEGIVNVVAPLLRGDPPPR
jgi:hypothetical protein